MTRWGDSTTMRRGHSIAVGVVLTGLLWSVGRARAEDAPPAAADDAALASAIRSIADLKSANGPAGDAVVRAGAAAVEPLRRELRAEGGRRLVACRLLARLGSVAKPALADLVEALEDDDEATRAEAAFAIEGAGWPEGA